MSDYFGRLAARTLDPACLLQPRITPRFAWQDEAGETESASSNRAPAITPLPPAEQTTIAPAGQPLPETTSTNVSIMRAASGKSPDVAATPPSQTSAIAAVSQIPLSDRPTRAGEPARMPHRPSLPPEKSLPVTMAAPGERVRTIVSTNAEPLHDEIPAHAEPRPPQHAEPPAAQTNVVVTPVRVERVVEHVRAERADDGAPHPVIPREPDVHVTIGRIDVRPASAPAPVRGVVPSRAPRPKTLTLEEYLAQRSEARR